MKHYLHVLLFVIAALALVGCPNPSDDPPVVASSNADLASLAVSSGTLVPAFSAATTAYAVDLGNEVGSLTATGTAADAKASLSANNGVPRALSVGENIITIRVTAEDGTTKDYVVTATRAAPPSASSNADLASLAVSSGTLVPAFSAATTAYAVDLGNEVGSLTATGTAADAKASLSANNGVSQALSVGENIITIRVTAEDGTTKDYVVTATRAAPPLSSNAYLASLVVSSGTLVPAFSAATTAYAVDLGNEVGSLTATGTAADAKASLSANNGVPRALSVGENIITIRVTAEDGTVKDYVVTATRAAPPVLSSNADLASLAVSEGRLVPSFSAAVTAYSVEVDGSVSSIVVTGTAADDAASLSANNGAPQALSSGANRIVVRATAEDGTVKDYVVTVERPGDYSSPYIGTMKYVPAGTFQLDEAAANTCAVGRFRMSECEISRAEFAQLMGKDLYNVNYSTGTADPVQAPRWYAAIAYCNKLSLAEGLTPVYSIPGVDFAALTYDDIPSTTVAAWGSPTADWEANGYRLPTEMEWLWAAMGADLEHPGEINTTGRLKAFAGSTGSNAVGDYAWYSVNSGTRTNPAGTRMPNELGLYDMSGNVAEFCWDYYGDFPGGALVDYRGAIPGVTPGTGSVPGKVVRGGDFGSGGSSFRLSSYAGRYKQTEDAGQVGTGFRVVRK